MGQSATKQHGPQQAPAGALVCDVCNYAEAMKGDRYRDYEHVCLNCRELLRSWPVVSDHTRRLWLNERRLVDHFVNLSRPMEEAQVIDCARTINKWRRNKKRRAANRGAETKRREVQLKPLIYKRIREMVRATML